MTTRQQMVVAVFDERAQAEQAVNELQNAGINPEQIRFAGQGSSSGGMLDKIKSVFTGTESEQRVRLREEQLRAQKQPVETGEARLRKDVVSEQQSMDVPVTHEEVYVERRPGSGQPTDQPLGEGETYRVPVRDEQVSVD